MRRDYGEPFSYIISLLHLISFVAFSSLELFLIFTPHHTTPHKPTTYPLQNSEITKSAYHFIFIIASLLCLSQYSLHLFYISALSRLFLRDLFHFLLSLLHPHSNSSSSFRTTIRIRRPPNPAISRTKRRRLLTLSSPKQPIPSPAKRLRKLSRAFANFDQFTIVR
jgi:hypothetical protein